MSELESRIRTELITAQEFKDDEALSSLAVALFEAKRKQEPVGGGGVYPKNWAPFPISQPILYKNGFLAKQVLGLGPFSKTYEQLISTTLYRGLTKKKYLELRKIYLID